MGQPANWFCNQTSGGTGSEVPSWEDSISMILAITGLIKNLIVLIMVMTKSRFTLDKQRKVIISILLADLLLLVYITVKDIFTYTKKIPAVFDYLQLYILPLAAMLWSQVCYVINMFVVVRFPFRSRVWKQRNSVKVFIVWMIPLVLLSVCYLVRKYGALNTCMRFVDVFIAYLFMTGPISLILTVWIPILICKSIFYSNLHYKDTSMLQQVAAIKFSLLRATVMCFVTSFGIPLNLVLSFLSDKYPNQNNVFNLFFTISYIIGLVAILMNPWIYALRTRDIWNHLKQNCCKCKRSDETTYLLI